MPAVTRYAWLIGPLLAGCGHSEPPPPAPPPAPPHERTVFDDLVDKKTSVPAAAETAQREHMEAARRAIDEADGAPPEGAPR